MILFDAPRRLGLRPTSFHSNVDFIEIKVDFIEIKVDFIEKKIGKMKNILFKHGPITLPYMST